MSPQVWAESETKDEGEMTTTFQRAEIVHRIEQAKGVLAILRRDREVDPPWYDTQIDSTLIEIENLQDEIEADDRKLHTVSQVLGERGIATDDAPCTGTLANTERGQKILGLYLAANELLERMQASGLIVPDQFREDLWDNTAAAAECLMPWLSLCWGLDNGCTCEDCTRMVYQALGEV